MVAVAQFPVQCSQGLYTCEPFPQATHEYESQSSLKYAIYLKSTKFTQQTTLVRYCHRRSKKKRKILNKLMNIIFSFFQVCSTERKTHTNLFVVTSECTVPSNYF